MAEIDRLTVAISAEVQNSFTSAIKSAQNQVSKLGATADNVNKKMIASASTTSSKIREQYLKEIDKLILETEIKLEALSSKINDSVKYFGENNQVALNLGIESDNLDVYYRTLKEFRDAVQGGAIDIDTQSMKNIPAAVRDATISVTEMQERMAGVNIEMSKLNSLASKLNFVTKKDPKSPYIDKIKQDIDEIIKKILTLKSITAEEFRLNLRTEYPGLNKMLNMSGYDFSGLTPGLNQESPQSIPKSESSSNLDSIGSDVGSIFKAVVGVRSIYMLIRKIVSQNENLTNALTNIFTSLANILSPILDFLAALINWLSTIIDSVRELLGIEVKQTSDTSKISKTIASFDELEVLNDKDNTSTTTDKYDFNDFIEDHPTFANPVGTEEYYYNPTDVPQAGPGLTEDQIEATRESLTKIWDSIKEFFGKIWDAIAGFFEKVWNKIVWFFTERIPGWFEDIKNKYTAYREKMRALETQMIEKIKGDWTKIKDSITGTWNKIGDAISGFWEKLKDKFKSIFSLGSLKLPKLASGGVAYSPTIAQIGDAGAGNPEIVAPQKLLQTMIESNNDNLISAFTQLTRQVITAIDNKDMDVSLDGMSITKSVAKNNIQYRKMTGVNLI